MSEWEQVGDLDYSKRKLNEWAKIYKLKILDQVSDERLISEYEFAYQLNDLDYQPDILDLEVFSTMELRAMELRRDVLLGANSVEKEILKDHYIETEWCRRKLNVL